MFCTKCGKEIKDGMNFCTNCGAEIAKIDRDDEKTVPIIRAGADGKKTEQVNEPKFVDDNAAPPFTGMQVEPMGKPKNGGMLAVIILLVIIILGTVFASFWFLAGKDMFSKPAVASGDEEGWEPDEDLWDGEDAEEWDNEETEESESWDDDADSFAEEETEEADWEDEEDASESYDAYEDDATDSEYILPDSDSAYLTKKDLKGLGAEQCRLARNEIYARHGRMFDDEELQAYFNRQSWYTPTIAPEDFQESMLNDYEMANRDLIVEYETKKGYR